MKLPASTPPGAGICGGARRGSCSIPPLPWLYFPAVTSSKIPRRSSVLIASGIGRRGSSLSLHASNTQTRRGLGFEAQEVTGLVGEALGGFVLGFHAVSDASVSLPRGALRCSGFNVALGQCLK